MQRSLNLRAMERVCAWRHPRPRDVAGRCIGRTDVAIDPRKVRRLARRIHRMATREGWPRVVCSSPLQRCRAVARHLKQLGWRTVVDATLLEMHFGRWDGLHWRDIPRAEVDAWVQDFAQHAPGGGESVAQVLARAAAWMPPEPNVTVVAHAGWMLARQWAMTHGEHAPPRADQWPMAPTYGSCCWLATP